MSLKKRNDLIFGLHFDFHASEVSPALGENLTPEMVQGIIDIAHPDFIQCDCKGHPGFASYPTKVGTPAPKIEKDILKIWRDVTQKNNIPLYVHYSGVFDGRAVAEHPEWRVFFDDGSFHPQATNLYGDYAEKLMIPQIKEIIEKYHINGVWVDGDCWGVLRNRSEEIKNRFKACTGLSVLPVKQGDTGFREYLELLRNLYRSYIKKYTEEIHKEFPEFEIASNYAYTTYMPEEINSDVDFLSGDIYGNDVINLAQYEAKYLAHQGKPWDIMSWNMASVIASQNDPTGGGSQYFCYKTEIQLMQEASQALAHGGGFQVYFTQEPDGSVKTEKLNQVKNLSDFCNARKQFCFGGKQKSEISILFSTEAAYDMANEAFGFMDGTLNFLKGDVNLISSLGLTVDLVSEHNLKNPEKYSLIVIPEWENVPEKQKYLNFAQNGGNILILGSNAVKNWQNELGVTVDGIVKDSKITLFNNEIMSNVGVFTSTALVKSRTARIVDTMEIINGNNAISTPSAVINSYGKGKISAICFDTGMMFKSFKDIVLQNLVKRIVDELLPQRKVEVIGSRYVAVTSLELNGRLCVGLLNNSGPHSDPSVIIYDEIPPIEELTVRVRCEKPNNIYLEPEHINMPFEYKDNVAEIKVKTLKIFDILVFDTTISDKY